MFVATTSNGQGKLRRSGIDQKVHSGVIESGGQTDEEVAGPRTNLELLDDRGIAQLGKICLVLLKVLYR